jgi:hypothetical protein
MAIMSFGLPLIVNVVFGVAGVRSQALPEESASAVVLSSFKGSAVKLPPSQNDLYSLGDLCRALSAGSGRIVIADKRCKDRLLLFISPDERVPIPVLMRAMSESMGLEWRPVGTAAFLTYTLDSRVIVERDKVVRLAEDSNAALVRAVLEHGLATVPVSASEFLAPPQRWGSLPGDRKKVFRDLALNAPQSTYREAVKSLFNDRDRLENTTVEFLVIPKVQVLYEQQIATGQGFQLIRLGLSGMGCD